MTDQPTTQNGEPTVTERTRFVTAEQFFDFAVKSGFVTREQLPPIPTVETVIVRQLDHGIVTVAQQMDSMRGGWVPSQQAVKSAMRIARYTRLDLLTMKYRTWCAEKRKSPTSQEWLMWVTRDEERAHGIALKEQAEAGKKKEWFDVAD